jgi:tetratricopeptide (TPR) repeat protein
VGAGGAARYFMLETVREYALELLEERSERESVSRRHAEHYTVLAEAVEDEHPARRSGAAWEGLEVEQDNFRAALDWSRDSGATDLQLRLAGALAYFWATSDHLREGDARVEEALRQAADATAPVRAKVLAGSAHIAHSIGDYERMRASAEASLELYRELADERRSALALNQLGIALSNLGDIDGGIACHEENAAISRRLGDDIRLSAALNNLGYCLLRRGQHDRAREHFEEGLAVSRKVEHRTAESVMLGNLGLAALLEGDRADALGFFRAGLAIDRELGYSEGMIYGLVGVAASLPATDDAAQLLGAAHAAAHATAVELEPLESEVDSRVTEQLTEALGAERFAEAYATGENLSLGDAVERAVSGTIGPGPRGT